MAKVVFILADGLGSIGAACLCYPAALCLAGKAARHDLFCELPPLSRPIYATLLSGLSPLEHGVVRNADSRLLTTPTIFSQSRGLKTAAAAYFWFFELCNGPFDPLKHRIFSDPDAPIQAGIFYSHDDYPDAELFADAEALRKSREPDLLLVHCMGADFAGHGRVDNFEGYYEACRRLDDLLAQFLPLWLEAGCEILLTGDHGMNRSGSHHGLEPEIRNVPLWLIGANWPSIENPRQTDIAGMIVENLRRNEPA